MAFAASLRTRSETVQSSFAQEAEAKIDAFTAQAMQDLQQSCETFAGHGYTSFSFDTETLIHGNGLWKDTVHGSEALAVQMVRASLEAKMAALGFSSALTVVYNGQMTLDHRPWTITTEGLSMRLGGKYRFHIEVSWSGASLGQAGMRGATTAAGSALQCIICFETRPAVALVPCGHTVCHDCARTLTNRPCPSCRCPVTSSTRGLFLG